MKNLILIVALTLLTGMTGLARADGVPLFTPAKANKALAQKYQSQLEWAGDTVTVKINPHALDSNVITVPIAGKTYRFVGRKTVSQMQVIENGQAAPHQMDSWSGDAGNLRVLLLSRTGDTVSGEISIDGDNYALMQDGMLIKRSSSRTPIQAVKK